MVVNYEFLVGFTMIYLDHGCIPIPSTGDLVGVVLVHDKVERVIRHRGKCGICLESKRPSRRIESVCDLS